MQSVMYNETLYAEIVDERNSGELDYIDMDTPNSTFQNLTELAYEQINDNLAYFSIDEYALSQVFFVQLLKLISVLPL